MHRLNMGCFGNSFWKSIKMDSAEGYYEKAFMYESTRSIENWSGKKKKIS